MTERDDLFGAAVQLAARLCAGAEPGSILVSAAVRDLAHGEGFTFRDHGHMALKGFDEPIQAFEVDWESTGSPSSRQEGRAWGIDPGMQAGPVHMVRDV